jgi:phage-related tail protein
LDNPTNAVLAPAVKQWDQARARMEQIQTTQGTNAPDVREAEAAANELGTIAEQTARSLVTVREAQLGGMAAKLGALNADLRDVTTNMEEFIAAHPDYHDALAKFQELKARRVDLQQKLLAGDAQNSAADAPLTALSTEIVELADAPSQPTTPNRHVATALVRAGLFFCIIGACVQFLKPAKKTKPAR